VGGLSEGEETEEEEENAQGAGVLGDDHAGEIIR